MNDSRVQSLHDKGFPLPPSCSSPTEGCVSDCSKTNAGRERMSENWMLGKEVERLEEEGDGNARRLGYSQETVSQHQVSRSGSFPPAVTQVCNK